MSDQEQEQVFWCDDDDPEMQEAYRRARTTFRYFWREVAWERRRIVPALDLACVKAPFSDREPGEPVRGNEDVEHMWLGEVDFDGQAVGGVLLNAPNSLKSVKAGDSVRIPLGQITDWMYVIQGEAYGACTVNLLRSRMSRQEREEHDAAWGLDFGDPRAFRVVPGQETSTELLRSWSDGHVGEELPEHPMSESMASSLEDRLAEDPSMVHAKDDRGWTLLHQQALAGSAATVKVLLERGADPAAVTGHGMTPLQLARSLGWGRVVALLEGRGAT